jgi:hypothetical protein
MGGRAIEPQATYAYSSLPNNGGYVAVGFDYAHDLKHVPDIAKEDHIGLVRVAAQAGTQVGARTSHLDRSSGKLIAFIAKLTHKPCSDHAAATPIGYVFRNGIQIILGGRRKAKPWHSSALSALLPLVELGFNTGFDFLVRIAAALLVGAIDVRAQGRELGLILRRQ